MEFVGEGYDGRGVCPEGEETACFSRRGGCDRGGFDEGYGVRGRVVEGVAGYVVGCRAAYYSSPWVVLVLEVGGWGGEWKRYRL